MSYRFGSDSELVSSDNGDAMIDSARGILCSGDAVSSLGLRSLRFLLLFIRWISYETSMQPGAHYPERATYLYSCNGVFTSKVIFRYAFPAEN